MTIDGVDAIFIGGRTDVLPTPTPDGNPDAFILKRHNFLVPEFPLTEELPPSVPIAEGAVVRVVSRAIGGVSFFNGFNGPIFGPDGNGASGSDLSSLGGISGYKGPQGALAGVFLDDSIPSVGPAPATLDFTPTGLGRDFGSLSPALGQVFFIGDGFRSKGQRHRFIAPSGATRLVLGIPDGDAFVGAPGFYDDNNGGYTVRIGVTGDSTREPTTSRAERIQMLKKDLDKTFGTGRIDGARIEEDGVQLKTEKGNIVIPLKKLKKLERQLFNNARARVRCRWVNCDDYLGQVPGTCPYAC